MSVARIFAISLFMSAAMPASAATIINAVADPGSVLISGTVVPGDDFTNNSPYSSSNVAYIMNEGTFGGKQTFLLHYDKDALGAYSGTVSGSFDIALDPSDIYQGVLTTRSGLLATDPANGALYQNAPGTRATTYRGFERDDYVIVTLNGLLVNVKYHLVNGNPLALDNARFAVGVVPEPASWAMMIAGFGMVGGAMRYRRRQKPVIA